MSTSMAGAGAMHAAGRLPRGALGAVLHASRVLGVAPFAADARVARALSAYGRTLNAVIIVPLSLEMLTYAVRHEGPWLVVEVIQRSLVVVAMVAITVGTHSAAGRVSRIFGILTQLDEVWALARRRPPATHWREIFYIVVFFVVIFILIATNFSFTKTEFIAVSVLYFVMHVLVHFGLSLLVLQLALAARCVAAALAAVNGALAALAPPAPPAPPTPHAFDEAIPTKFGGRRAFPREAWPERRPAAALGARALRRLAAAHAVLRDTLRTFDADGPFLVLTLGLLFVCLTYFFYVLILWGLFLESSMAAFPCDAAASCVTYCTCFMLMIEPFHKTHLEMQRTHLLVHHLKCHQSDDPRVALELQLFSRVLSLTPTSHSPLGLCTLARPMVVKTIGCIFTYLLIALTYGPDPSALAGPTLAGPALVGPTLAGPTPAARR